MARKKIIPGIIAATMLLLPCLGWAQWTDAYIDTITTNTNTQIQEWTWPQSLDLDSLDYIHLVWEENRRGGYGSRIFYSTNSPDGRWLPPQEVGDSAQASSSPGLAISPLSNYPFVVFEQGSEIYVAHRTEREWKREQVTFNSQLVCYPTIAVDNLGLIHLAWITDDSGTGEYKIAYSLGDSANWDIQTLAGSNLGPFGTGACPYIAVSSQGVAHIVYRGGDYHIHHAWNDSLGGRNWSYETMVSDNLEDFSSALVIEDDGDLHLAVHGDDGWGLPGRIYYFYQPQGQSWLPFELATLSYSAVGPSLDVDEYGFPHIIWEEVSGNIYTGNIFYSHQDTSGNWQVSFVIGEKHYSPSFKVDHQGFGHVGCYTGGYMEGNAENIYHIKSRDRLTAVKEFPTSSRRFCSYYLLQNYPNPFNSTTAISYQLSAVSGQRLAVSLKIYNILGKEVRSLIDNQQKAGSYRVVWDGRDNEGKEVTSGIYICLLRAGAFGKAGRMVLIR